MVLDKHERMQQIKKDCSRFFADIYPEDRRILVFGEGSLDADILVVGEAPGQQETQQQKPFVGTAGKNLDAFLQAVEIEREKLYITNVVKFRPTKSNPSTGRISNRPPTREEIALCQRFLREEIQLISPKVLVTLGNVALKAVSGNDKLTIGAVHGELMEAVRPDGVVVSLFPLYHPASIIYNRELREVYEQDVQAFAALAKQQKWLGL